MRLPGAVAAILGAHYAAGGPPPRPRLRPDGRRGRPLAPPRTRGDRRRVRRRDLRVCATESVAATSARGPRRRSPSRTSTPSRRRRPWTPTPREEVSAGRAPTCPSSARSGKPVFSDFGRPGPDGRPGTPKDGSGSTLFLWTATRGGRQRAIPATNAGRKDRPDEPGTPPPSPPPRHLHRPHGRDARGPHLTTLPRSSCSGHVESGSRAGMAHPTGTAQGGRGCSCEAFRFRPGSEALQAPPGAHGYALRGGAPAGRGPDGGGLRRPRARVRASARPGLDGERRPGGEPPPGTRKGRRNEKRVTRSFCCKPPLPLGSRLMDTTAAAAAQRLRALRGLPPRPAQVHGDRPRGRRRDLRRGLQRPRGLPHGSPARRTSGTRPLPHRRGPRARLVEVGSRPPRRDRGRRHPRSRRPLLRPRRSRCTGLFGLPTP